MKWEDWRNLIMLFGSSSCSKHNKLYYKIINEHAFGGELKIHLIRKVLESKA